MVLGREEAVENGGLGVVRIAQLIGREKSQVSRALKTLAESGLVDRDPSTLHYRLGWRFFALAARAGEQMLLSVAPPLLERLMKSLGETVHLSVLQGAEDRKSTRLNSSYANISYAVFCLKKKK